MLTHLSIQNFTLVDSLELELSQGMTTITGETGAGKSILLDALGLTLGDRASPDQIRNHQNRADICATFDLSNHAEAQRWLEARDLSDNRQCLLRRVINSDGRSRGYINGQPAPLNQLKELGEMLIDIHSQHAHQSLLKKETHQRLLDEFGNLQADASRCGELYRQWKQVQQAFEQKRDNAEEISAKTQLLRYQVHELDALALQENELEQLEVEQRQLSNAESAIHSAQQATEICDHEELGLLSSIHKALHLLEDINDKPDSLKSSYELLCSADIQIQEALSELSRYIDTFEADPQRLQEIEERLSSCYEIARKHRIQPQQLHQLYLQLNDELDQLGDNETLLDQLQEKATLLLEEYLCAARKLSAQRVKTAKKLQKQVNQQLQQLSMKNALFEISIQHHNKPHPSGLDEIEFLISTNPGQTVKPLAKVASGGELSRISLSIQVVTAQSSSIPTLVFDEVDVGIGGSTADIVGKLLRKLGQQGQVICVTHLPQVASKAQQHLLVHKENTRKSAQSTLTRLEGEDKTMEIARMMGGTELTRQTVAHAREMLEMAE